MIRLFGTPRANPVRSVVWINHKPFKENSLRLFFWPLESIGQKKKALLKSHFEKKRILNLRSIRLSQSERLNNRSGPPFALSTSQQSNE
jgi:hypothetical protein